MVTYAQVCKFGTTAAIETQKDGAISVTVPHTRLPTLHLSDVIDVHDSGVLDRYGDEDYKNFRETYDKMWGFFLVEKKPDDLRMQNLEEIVSAISDNWDRTQLSLCEKKFFEGACVEILDVAPLSGGFLNQMLFHMYVMCIGYLNLPTEREDLVVPIDTYVILDETYFCTQEEKEVPRTEEKKDVVIYAKEEEVFVFPVDDYDETIHDTIEVNGITHVYFKDTCTNVKYIGEHNGFTYKTGRVPRRVLRKMRANVSSNSCMEMGGSVEPAICDDQPSRSEYVPTVEFPQELGMFDLGFQMWNSFGPKTIEHDLTPTTQEAINKVQNTLDAVRQAFESLPDRFMQHDQTKVVINSVEKLVQQTASFAKTKDELMAIGKAFGALTIFGFALYFMMKVEDTFKRKLGIALVSVAGGLLGGYAVMSLATQFTKNYEQEILEKKTDFQSGVIDSFSNFLVSALHVHTFHKKPKEGLVGEILKGASHFPRQSQGISKFIEWVMSIFRSFLSWLERTFGFEFSILRSGNVKVDKWIAKAKTFATQEFTIENNLQLHILINEGQAIVREYKQYPELTGPVEAYVLALKTAQDKMRDVMTGTIDTRMCPLLVCLSGKPGVGKTQAVNHLTREVLLRSFVETDNKYMATQLIKDPNRVIYSRNNQQEFWDGYKNQTACVFDDFLQAKDVAGGKSEVFEIIKACNTWNYNLPMANLSDKANTMFTSSVIICTTNALRVESAAIKSEEAAERRFDAWVYVVPKPEFCVDPKAPIHDRRLDTTSLEKFNPDIYEFHFADMRTRNGSNAPYDPQMNGRDPVVMNWSEFVQYCSDAYTKKFNQFNVTVKETDERLQDIAKELGVHFQMDALSVLPEASEISSEDHLTVRSEPIQDVSYREYAIKATSEPNYSHKSEISEAPRHCIDEEEFYIDIAELDALRTDTGWPRLSALENLYKLGLNQSDHLLDKFRGERKRFMEHTEVRYCPGIEYNMFIRKIHWMKDFYSLDKELFPEINPRNADGEYELEDQLEMIWRMAVFDSIYDNPDEEYLEDKDWRCALYVYLRGRKAVASIEKQRGKWIRLSNNINKGYDTIKRKLQVFFQKHKTLFAFMTAGAVLAGIISIVGLTTNLFDCFSSKQEETNFEASSQPRGRKNVKFESASKGDSQLPYNGIGNAEENYQRNMEKFVRESIDSSVDVEYQGGDSRGHSLAACIFNANQYSIEIDGRHRGNVTFLQDYVCMFPAHYKYLIRASIEAGEIPAKAQVLFKSFVQERVIKMTMEQFLGAREFDFFEGSDVAFLEVPKVTGQHRSILRNFCSADNMEKINDSYVVLDVPNVGHKCMANHVTKAVRKDWVIENEHHKASLQRAFVYRAQTRVGDCGALLRVDTNRGDSERIIGMHVGGGASGIAVATCIDKERVQRAFDLMNTHKNKGDDISMQFHMDERICIVDSPFSGDFVSITKTKEKVRVPTSTKICPSVLYGEWGESEYMPAWLRPFHDENGEKIDPIPKMLTAYGNSVEEVHEETLGICADHLFHTVNNATLDCPRRVVDYHTAVVGDPDRTFLSSIPRGTSAGFPFSARGYKGKRDFFGFGDEFEFGSPDELALRSHVTSIIEDAKQGIRQDHVFQDFPKDERRRIPKAMAGKTRMISGSPLAYLIACRMYFLDFTVAMMESRVDVEMCVGVNPYGMDWHRIAMKLLGKGENIVAGDYTNYDKSQSTQVHIHLIHIINRWYNGTPEENRVRFVLYADLYNAIHVSPTGHIYGYTHCLPSGHMLTTIANSLFNSLAFRFAYVAAHDFDSTSVLHFNKYIALCVYGDDNICSVHEEKLDIFNQKTLPYLMKTMNLVYTTEDKEEATFECRSLDECSFLKRDFVFADDFKRFIAPLELGVILEMPYWTKMGSETIEREITKDTVGTALGEAALHGENVFLECVAKIEPACRKHKIPIASTCFHALRKHMLTNESLIH